MAGFLNHQQYVIGLSNQSPYSIRSICIPSLPPRSEELPHLRRAFHLQMNVYVVVFLESLNCCSYTPQKKLTWDTQNDALEHVSPWLFYVWPFLVSMFNFWGVGLVSVSSRGITENYQKMIHPKSKLLWTYGNPSEFHAILPWFSSFRD